MKSKYLLHLMGLAVLVFFLWGFSSSVKPENPLKKVEDWFILLNYNPTTSRIEQLEPFHYEMAILDPDNHPPLLLFEDRVILIAYLSIGEAETYRAYWKKIEGKSWIVGRNPNWEGNYFVDIRNKEWRDILIREVIPKIVDQDFSGLMLDTLDTAEYLKSLGEGKYQGADKAMVELVKEIHKKYPKLYLISNNGFSILKDIAPYLSGMLVESVNHTIDFENNAYKPVSAEDRIYKVQMLKPLMEQYGLPVFDIDYAAMNQPDVIQESLKRSRELGFVPYVAEKNLSEVYSLQYDSH